MNNTRSARQKTDINKKGSLRVNQNVNFMQKCVLFTYI